jgi:hypothetical protein
MAPNPTFMADEVVREKTLRLCLSNIIHANRKRRLLMDMAVNNLLARRRQKMHSAPHFSSIIVRGTRVRVKPDILKNSK